MQLFQEWTWNQYKAAGKHVASAAAGAVGLAVTLHFVTPEMGSDIGANINDITSGLTQFMKGISGLVAAGTLLYTSLKAANNASPIMQAKSLQETVPGTVIVTSSKIADATPENPHIVSNQDVKVIAKN